MSKNWFKVGEEGIKEKMRQDKAREAMSEKKVHRFWMKPGDKAKIIFLDDEALFCNIHQFKVNGRWDNFVTCTSDFKPCAVCEQDPQKKSVFTAHYSILDLRQFTRKDGTVVKYTKKILPAKGSAIHRLYDLKQKYGSLVGRVFEVNRYSDNDPNCGGSFDYLGKMKEFEKKFSKEDRTPFDLVTVLAPPTAEELEQFGFEMPVIPGSDEDVSSSEKEIEIDDEDVGSSEELEIDTEKEEEAEVDIEEPKPTKKKDTTKKKKEMDEDDVPF